MRAAPSRSGSNHRASATRAADARGDELLLLAAGGDAALLRLMRARVAAGEPAPYVAGFLCFRGRRFRIDPRAYITDPESTYLVDLAAEEGAALARKLGRPPLVLEFGTGAGTLAISLQLDHPSWAVTGLDLDPDALALAQANAREHGAAVALFASDSFSAWPVGAAAPDLIFGDPPWGSAEDLYDPQRGADYYRRMPARSAFPPGENRCAVHDEIIARVRERGWASTLVLNYGVLPRALVLRSAAALREHRLVCPAPGLTLLVGRAL